MKPAPGFGGDIYTGKKKQQNSDADKPVTHLKGEVIIRKEFDVDGKVIYDNIAKDPSHKPLIDQPEGEHHIPTDEGTQETKVHEAKEENTQEETHETKPEEVKKEVTADFEKPEKKNKIERTKTGVEVQEESTKKSEPSIQILTSDYLKSVDMKMFLMSPAPQGYVVQCSIKREKSGFMNMNPKYLLHLDSTFLLGAKKRSGNKTSNYAVSMNEKEYDPKTPGYLGKLRSNFMGTEFNIWNNGKNPKKAGKPEEIREQLGVVLYESNLASSKGPRKMRAIFPEVQPDGKYQQFRPATEKEGMQVNLQAGKTEGLKVYINKSPKWNESVQAFVLNFRGRVNKASVKNFQLVDQSNDENVLLQFGRVDDTHFIMDFQWPLTPFQAFSICLTSFDYKFGCE